MANNGHRPETAPIPEALPERETTDKLVSDVLAAGQDLGVAGDSPEDVMRKTLTALVTTVRNGGGGGGNGGPPPPPAKGFKHPITLGLLKYVITALLAMGAAYGGLKLADQDNAKQIGAVKADAAVHKAKPAHNGAATKVEVKAVEDKVNTLDKSVIKLGTKIDGQETRQKERHDDIKDELRYLRRRRNRRDD